MNTNFDWEYQEFRQTGDIINIIEALVAYTKHLEERIEKLENKGESVGH